jgi:SM-20-related protein
VGRRLQGDLVRATPAADNWVRVDGGFMMLEKPGLSRLLEPLSADEFEAASAAADARTAATRRETEALVERACAAALATAAPGADEGALRARIRADVLRRTAAAEMTRTHHLASRAIVGAPAGSAACAEADAFVASSRLVDGLLARGYVVVEDVLDATAARAARQEAESLGERLKPTLQALTGTRSDRVGWFGADELAANSCPTLARLARLQRGVAAAINADGRWRETLTVPASSMLSCYGAGGRYRRHTDNSRNADGVCGNARALTCICYLNPDWAAEDGGALRIYDESGDSVEVVVPAAGRFVVFDSFLEHEVLEARRDRYALTFWVFAER